MTDDAAFLAAILAAPNDNTPRLVYADWLDEREQPERAAFIRIECEQPAAELFSDERFMWTYRLKEACRDLDPEWVAAVSRVTLDEMFAREREVMSWRTRRVTVNEMLAEMAKWDSYSTPAPGFWGRVRGLFGRRPPPAEGFNIRVMREWVETRMQPGDELWEYNTGGESWQHLAGEMGYVIVRDGKLHEFTMLLMN